MFGKNAPHIERKDALAALIAGLVVALIGLVFAIPPLTGGYVATLAAGLTFMLAVLFRKLNDSMRFQEDRYRQVEELFSLFNLLQFRLPLPALRGWAMSPDLANIIVGTILREKPKRVLDLGSGVSTVVMGYALEKIGGGTVLAIDHHEDYAERTRRLLKEHGLEDIASVKVAPLSEVNIPAGPWRWYDPAFVRDLGEIDLVVIDGPPDRSHFLARYPALPLLFNNLSHNGIVIVDDMFGSSEREMVKRWLIEFPDLVEEKIGTEKGTSVLRRRAR
jgi:predicted O-methyltransferase YrrM